MRKEEKKKGNRRSKVREEEERKWRQCKAKKRGEGREGKGSERVVFRA